MTGGIKEKEIICGLERAIEGNDRVARRKLLDRLVVLLFTTDTAAPALVSQGGVPALLAVARDRDEKIRLHAVHALSKLAQSGFSREIRDAGGVQALASLLSDPYQPIRDMAEKCLDELKKT